MLCHRGECQHFASSTTHCMNTSELSFSNVRYMGKICVPMVIPVIAFACIYQINSAVYQIAGRVLARLSLSWQTMNTVGLFALLETKTLGCSDTILKLSEARLAEDDENISA